MVLGSLISFQAGSLLPDFDKPSLRLWKILLAVWVMVGLMVVSGWSIADFLVLGTEGQQMALLSIKFFAIVFLVLSAGNASAGVLILRTFPDEKDQARAQGKIRNGALGIIGSVLLGAISGVILDFLGQS